MIYKQPPSWLAHHGIEGQKWGVKHGPPYPLDSSVSTGNKLKEHTERGIGAATAAFYAISVAATLAPMAIPLATGYASSKKHNKKIEDYKNSYKTYESHFGETAKKIANGDKETINKCKKTGDPNVVTKQDLLAINAYGMENPNAKNHTKVDNKKHVKNVRIDFGSIVQEISYDRAFYGREKNCPNCTTAFILNKMGWKLNAAPVFDRGRTSSEIFNQNKEMFKGSKRTEIQKYSEFKNELKSKPDGSFGSFDFKYRGEASGHILNWAKEDGKVFIYDAQNGKKMNIGRFAVSYNPDFGYGSYIHDMTGATIDWNKVAEYKYTY